MKRPARFLQSRKADGLILSGLMFGNPVEITEKKVELGKPLWINIAYEGEFKGHPSSPDGAVFNEELFDKLIANVHSHPKFKAGPDGVGTQRVVPTDYEHNSERDPSSGSIPAEGAPSPAWVWDIRKSRDANGRLNLDALTEISSPKLVEQINTSGYRFTSVAIWGNATDGTTGEKIGPVLTSFAFTNHNFLPDLHPILASAWVSRAESPEEVVIGLRDIFQLPSEATAEQVSAELVEFAARMIDGTLPEGVKACDVIDRLRSLLGIRLLASNDEVLEAARQMLAGAGYTEGEPGNAPTKTQEQVDMTLSTKLAKLFSCRDSEESILMAAEDTSKTATASTDALKQLQDMFGSKDVQSLIKAAGEQIAMAEKVKGLVEALKTANDSMGQMDDAMAEAEVNAVVASMTHDIADQKARAATAAKIKPGVLAFRKSCTGEVEMFGLKVKRVDAAKLGEFRETYPLPPAELALLTQRIFAAPGGQQVQMSVDAQGRMTQGALPPAQRGAEGDDRAAKLKGLPGRNNTEKAMALLTKERADFASMDRLDQVQIASAWLRGESD